VKAGKGGEGGVFPFPGAPPPPLPPFPPFFDPVAKNVCLGRLLLAVGFSPTVSAGGPVKAGKGGEGGVSPAHITAFTAFSHFFQSAREKCLPRSSAAGGGVLTTVFPGGPVKAGKGGEGGVSPAHITAFTASSPFFQSAREKCRRDRLQGRAGDSPDSFRSRPGESR
jgi:hypothetical protein